MLLKFTKLQTQNFPPNGLAKIPLEFFFYVKALREGSMGMAHKRSVGVLQCKKLAPRFSTVSGLETRPRQGPPTRSVASLYTWSPHEFFGRPKRFSCSTIRGRSVRPQNTLPLHVGERHSLRTLAGSLREKTTRHVFFLNVHTGMYDK